MLLTHTKIRGLIAIEAVSYVRHCTNRWQRSLVRKKRSVCTILWRICS